MSDKEWGLMLGGYLGAPTLGYHYGAKKLLAFLFCFVAGGVLLLKALGVERPEPLKPSVCVQTEVKTYRSYGYNAELGWISYEQTGPVCMKWERPQ